MSKQLPKVMLTGGCITAGADTILTVWTLFEAMSAYANPIVAFIVALGAGLILYSLQIALFIQGLRLAYEENSPSRSFSLTMIFLVAFMIGITSFTFNLERIAGDLMQAISTQEQFDKRIDVKESVEEVLKQGFDQKANIRSVQETAEKWLECEVQKSCISGKGSGTGPVSSLLNSFALTTKNAERVLVDLEAEIEPLAEKAYLIIQLYGETENIVDLDFDAKEERRTKLSEQLNEVITELQALIPVSVFNGLDKELGKTTATYRALNIGEDASKRIKTQFQSYADEFERQATLMRKAQHFYLPPVEQRSRMEVLTSSSDVIPYLLISLAIAFGTWILLGIHILSVRQDEKTPPSSNTNQLKNISPQTVTETIAPVYSNLNTSKH